MFIAPQDGHKRCLSCLGLQHAEAALRDSSCSTCEGMTMADLRRRVSFLRERRPPSKSGAAKGAATKLAKDDLRITVLGRSAGSSSSSQRPDPLPAEVPMETSGPCSTVSSPSVEPHLTRCPP